MVMTILPTLEFKCSSQNDEQLEIMNSSLQQMADHQFG